MSLSWSSGKCRIYFLAVYKTKGPGYRIFILLSIKAFTGRRDKQFICQKYCSLQNRSTHERSHHITMSWENKCLLDDVAHLGQFHLLRYHVHNFCFFTIVLRCLDRDISGWKALKPSLSWILLRTSRRVSFPFFFFKELRRIFSQTNIRFQMWRITRSGKIFLGGKSKGQLLGCVQGLIALELL